MIILKLSQFDDQLGETKEQTAIEQTNGQRENLDDINKKKSNNHHN